MNVKYFLSAMIITVTVTTGALLMPFAEYNSSRFMTAELEKMGEISFDEEAVSVGFFGEKLSVKTDELSDVLTTAAPFLPNEIKLSAELVHLLAEYIGEAF